MSTLCNIAKSVAEDTALFSQEDCPFIINVKEGLPDVIVITGENASGKSLAYRLISYKLSDEKVLPVSLSIRERTGAGSFESAGLRRIFMYGDESEQSTGATSVNTTLSGFKNMYKEGDKPVALMLDEPELGLSDGYAAAFGTLIALKHLQALAESPNYRGLVLVSHNRPLISNFVTALEGMPTFVSMDSDITLDKWLVSPQVKSVDDLLDLNKTGEERMRYVRKFIANRSNKS